MKTEDELRNEAIVGRYLELYDTGEVEQAVRETMVEALEWEWAATPLYPAASGRTRDGLLEGLVRGLGVERRGLASGASSSMAISSCIEATTPGRSGACDSTHSSSSSSLCATV